MSGSSRGSASSWEKTDIFAKIALGVAGLIISVALAWVEHSRRVQEDRRLVQEAADKRETALTSEFRIYYMLARTSGAPSDQARRDLDIARPVAEELGRRYQKEYYQEAAITLQASLDNDGTPRAPGGLAPATLQADEAALKIDSKARGRWFAVLASYPETGFDLAKARAAYLTGKGLPCVQVWQTRSNHVFAVVSGGLSFRSQALTSAQNARDSALAPDAFVQVNKDWIWKAGCPNTKIEPTDDDAS